MILQQQQKSNGGSNCFGVAKKGYDPSVMGRKSSLKKKGQRSLSSAALRKMEMAEEARLLKSLEQDIKFDSILAQVLANAGVPPGTTRSTQTQNFLPPTLR